MKPKAKCAQNKESRLHISRVRGLGEMKPGSHRGKRKKGRAWKPAALEKNLWTGEWAKPSRLRRRREDLELHPATVNNQAGLCPSTYKHIH